MRTASVQLMASFTKSVVFPAPAEAIRSLFFMILPDELVLQRAYMDKHEGKLPIEDGVEIISLEYLFFDFWRLLNA